MKIRPRSMLATVPALTLALGVCGTSGPASAQSTTRGPAGGAFAREPRNPRETWAIVDYLMKVGQPEQAAPYVKRFLDANPDDQTILLIRDEFGAGSILRLSDELATRPYARPLAQKLAAASAKAASDVTRLGEAIEALTGTAEEQVVALEQIREAGSFAVPPLIRALEEQGRTPEERALIARSLGRLDRKAVPALIAVLDSPDPTLVADAARALGQIGDPRALPTLTYLAARKNPESPARDAAGAAIQQLTGRPFGSQPRSPARLLVDEARQYQAHQVRFPGDPVVIWAWDDAAKAPAARSVAVRDAEGILGLKAARQALAIEPGDLPAQSMLVALALEHDPAGSKATALAAGPDIQGRVLRTAIADGRDDLAISAIAILAEVTDRESLTARGDRPHPLVEALGAPDRRVQFAAAEALVRLDPRVAFAGSSRLVPAVARFVGGGSVPRVVVIDGNAVRAAEIIGPLRTLGYDAQLAESGSQGFALAARSADIEFIVMDPHFVHGSWGMVETLRNLASDSRTAGIPVFLSGNLDLHNEVASRLDSFPDVLFLATPSEAAPLKGQIDRSLARRRYRPLSDEERADYARRASSLLAQIARRPGSPFESGLAAVEPELARALAGPTAAIEAAEALGGIPGADPQKSLATTTLDASRPMPLRIASAQHLARNIRRFGPRLTAEQERLVIEELAREPDAALRDALAAVVGTLRPGPDASGTRLQTYRAPSSE
ncbi:HEAT repeat domain-containing protein [Tundrisphaera sp. TA3]|uniref:HEAT repeat domain-containing protein n=1 Tax=Tundrisphaera sp. TA3 TaxID=3435775 RepID=UPI003EBAB337